jgi:hypothetical protein
VALAGTAALPYFIADSSLAHTVAYHYWALPVTMMFAAIMSPAENRNPYVPAFILVGLIGGPFGIGWLGPGGVTIASLASQFRDQRAYIDEAHRAIGGLPNTSVALTSELTPHTGHLDQVYVLPHPFHPLTATHGDRITVIRDALPVRPEYSLGQPPDSGYKHLGGIIWRRTSPS